MDFPFKSIVEQQSIFKKDYKNNLVFKNISSSDFLANPRGTA
jgi:hypothetical protein